MSNNSNSSSSSSSSASRNVTNLEPESSSSSRARSSKPLKKSIKKHLAISPAPPGGSAKPAAAALVTDYELEEVHRPGDRVVHVDLEEIERQVRGGTTPDSRISTPASSADSSLLDRSDFSLDGAGRGGPKTSTPKKSASKSRSSRRRGRQPDNLYKRALLQSASAHNLGAARPATPASAASNESSRLYRTAQESLNDSALSVRGGSGYRSANATSRALFAHSGAAVERRSRSTSRSRRSPANNSPAAAALCQLVTPLMVNTSQEVNAISVTGQILVISQTLVRSAHASHDVRKLMHRLAETRPIISNEMAQTDLDHDNESTKHEVFVGDDAILIQRVSTIHRGRDRNSFETDDRRTYRFVCAGDLLPEDRRNKQSKPRHLTIVAESATIKGTAHIEKSERVVLIFDAADAPAAALPAAIAPETSLTHAANDLTARPSALRDSAVAFEEHVRVSDHSHINVVRKAHIVTSGALWEEPRTELKEQRVYTQQLAADADCEPVRITRSHSMSRDGGSRDRSRSASRSRAPASGRSRGRTPSRNARPSAAPPALPDSPTVLSWRASDKPTPRAVLEFTPSPVVPVYDDVLTAITPMKDEPARRETALLNSTYDLSDATGRDSVSLPLRNTDSVRSPATAIEQVHQAIVEGGHRSSRSRSSSADSRESSRVIARSAHRTPSPCSTARSSLSTQSTMASATSKSYLSSPVVSAFTAMSRTPERSPRAPHVAIIDEDTSAGSSQSPTLNRTPTMTSPRTTTTRLPTRLYQSPTAPTTPTRRLQHLRPEEREWDSMLDRTQAGSPMGAGSSSFSRSSRSALAASNQLLKSLSERKAAAGATATRPLGAARSCLNLDAAAAAAPLAAGGSAARRARSEHCVLSASALAEPFRMKKKSAAAAAASGAAAPVPRPRTTRPSAASASATSADALRVSASAAKQQKATAAAASQKNVEIVQNPEQYDKGEIVMKKLTLEARINGHMWDMSVSFALKADRADEIRFQPKRVRLDDQTLWEDTENWSQTSLTPVLTGPRTVARGSTSYDQLQQLQPLAVAATPRPALPGSASSSSSGGSSSNSSTPSTLNATMVHVTPKTASTASSSTSKRSSTASSDKSKKSQSSKKSSEDKKKSASSSPSI